MLVEKLKALLEEHKDDPNYQHREKTWDEIDQMAFSSFAILSQEHKQKVTAIADKHGINSLQLLTRARFMAQTNLFFLCKLLETYKDVSRHQYLWTDGKLHNTHEEICNEFFVRKDPRFKTFKQFALDYSLNNMGKKERLLLVPRGGFKSSMDMADCVQWIICFPDVTILVLTGILQLAKDFVGEIKGHFELDDADDSGSYKIGKHTYKAKSLDGETPILFQALFPEHCIPKDEGKGDEYQTPAVAVRQKEGTLSAASIEQSLTGWHVGVLKLDDVVTNENSLTIDRLKAVNKQVSVNQAMLHPYGFYDKIGTWYDSEDTYGHDIKNAKKAAEDGEDFGCSIYIRPAWWATEEAKKAGKIPEEMQKGDYVLWFPDEGQLTYEFLKDKFKRDPYFAIKYLNDPTQMHVVKFPRELLIRRTIAANLIPQTGMMVTTVDTAYSLQNWADYTVIITALIYGGRFYIVDMQRGRMSEYELPTQIAIASQKWKPKRICIEDNHGRWIGREIYREMDKLKTRSPLEFVTLGKGDKKVNSKQIKAKPVLRYLGDERLLFSNSCPNLQEMYDELEKFGTAASTHDDIVDALSLLVNQFASYAEMEAKATALQANYFGDPKAREMEAFYNATYCLGQHAKDNLASAELENPEASRQQLLREQFQVNRDDRDPLEDLF